MRQGELDLTHVLRRRCSNGTPSCDMLLHASNTFAQRTVDGTKRPGKVLQGVSY